MDITAIAQHIFYNDKYATETTGISIDSVDENTTVCSLMLNDSHRNAKGNVMGGVIFTLADFAFAIAANSSIIADKGKEAQLQWVSSSATNHFLVPAKGNSLIATTTPIRQGHSQSVYQTVITDSENRKVALITTLGSRINV